MSSRVSQWGQEQGADTPVKGQRQYQGTAEPKLRIAIANSFFPFIPLAEEL